MEDTTERDTEFEDASMYTILAAALQPDSVYVPADEMVRTEASHATMF